MTSKVKPVPEGYHTATPYLIIKGAAQAIEFYKKAFGATELDRVADASGKIRHAQIKIGDSPFMITDESPDFPATKHVAPSFPFSDEFYQPRNISREKVDVLLRLDLSNVPPNPGLRLNGDYPLAWAKLYGKGRVFFGSFAHSSETWDRRDVQQMYFEALRWALGLTDAEPQPHPMRGRAAPTARGRGGE